MEHCPLLITKETNKKQHAHLIHSSQQTWVFFSYVEMIELITVCEGYNKHYQFMASHKTTAHLLWESINIVFILFNLVSHQ